MATATISGSAPGGDDGALPPPTEGYETPFSEQLPPEGTGSGESPAAAPQQ
eukprot:GAFH01003743.1.p5 GENE.GAFH01003743.1~~GAFH01003743.1.p5  ORF type:complete len:51 (-),score=6.55 GAFH01003743.1:172-324(-)